MCVFFLRSARNNFTTKQHLYRISEFFALRKIQVKAETVQVNKRKKKEILHSIYLYFKLPDLPDFPG